MYVEGSKFLPIEPIHSFRTFEGPWSFTCTVGCLFSALKPQSLTTTTTLQQHMLVVAANHNCICTMVQVHLSSYNGCQY